MRRLAWGVVLVALAAGGCTEPKESSRSTVATAVAGGDGEPVAPPPTDPATGKQGKVTPADRYTASAPPPPGFRAADSPGETGEVALEASVSPGCVEHGQELTVVFKSAPGMTVAAQIKWPNDQFSGLDNTRGKASGDGQLTWKVRVQPTALYGVAELQAATIDESPSGRPRSGSFGNWSFVVAAPGGC